MDARRSFLHIYDMSRGHFSAAIPTYGLYGERGELPDLLHCERLPDRAHRYGGIAPHRHKHLHQFFLFTAGGGEVTLDGLQLPLHGNLLLNVPPNCVHGFEFDSDAAGCVITVSEAVMQGAALPEDIEGSLKRAFAGQADTSVRTTSAEIEAEHRKLEPGRGSALGYLAALLAIQVARLEHRAAANVARRTKRYEPSACLTAGFEALVERHFGAHWPISAYAAELNVTATHLGRVIRSTRGTTPRELVAARLMLQARRLLAYTNRPIWHVGEDLGFSDPAYFTRFVKRHAGLSPGGLRRRLQR